MSIKNDEKWSCITCFTLNRALFQSNYYRRNVLSLVAPAKARLVTHSTCLTTRSTLSTPLSTLSTPLSTRSTPLSTRSTRFSTRSTCLSIRSTRLFTRSTRLSTRNICLPTRRLCLSTRKTRSTICWSFYNWSSQNFDFLNLKNLSRGQFLGSSYSRKYHWILKLLNAT